MNQIFHDHYMSACMQPNSETDSLSDISKQHSYKTSNDKFFDICSSDKDSFKSIPYHNMITPNTVKGPISKTCCNEDRFINSNLDWVMSGSRQIISHDCSNLKHVRKATYGDDGRVYSISSKDAMESSGDKLLYIESKTARSKSYQDFSMIPQTLNGSPKREMIDFRLKKTGKSYPSNVIQNDCSFRQVKELDHGCGGLIDRQTSQNAYIPVKNNRKPEYSIYANDHIQRNYFKCKQQNNLAYNYDIHPGKCCHPHEFHNEKILTNQLDESSFGRMYEMNGLKSDTIASSSNTGMKSVNKINMIECMNRGDSQLFDNFDDELISSNQRLHHKYPFIQDDSFKRFSRKVFVGGLPPDIDEDEIKSRFIRFGALVVDWPHKAESKSYFPPKGYAFLLFSEEISIQNLVNACMKDNEKLYFSVSSPTMRDKTVQVRPWDISDSDYVLDDSLTLDPRKTVFVGGIPRPLRASQLAHIMNDLYGGVCYAGIDTDPELKYPKGAGRVAFSNQKSYIAAISARFIHLKQIDIDKRVEVKPYLLDDQQCDQCEQSRTDIRLTSSKFDNIIGKNDFKMRARKYAPFFCANLSCLRYYCDSCWSHIHSQSGLEYHKPLVKEGSERLRLTNMMFKSE